MKFLISALTSISLLVNAPTSYANNRTDVKNTFNRESSDNIYKIMKSGDLNKLLKESKPRLEPEYYNFLSKKISGLKDKRFNVTRLGPSNFRLRYSNTIVNFQAIDPFNGKFSINNHKYTFDYSKSPELTWVEIRKLLPKKQELNGLHNLFLPRAHAIVFLSVVGVATLAMVSIGVSIRARSCRDLDKQLTLCEGLEYDVKAIEDAFSLLLVKIPAFCSREMKNLRKCLINRYGKLSEEDKNSIPSFDKERALFADPTLLYAPAPDKNLAH